VTRRGGRWLPRGAAVTAAAAAALLASATPVLCADEWSYFGNFRSVEDLALEGTTLWGATTAGVLRCDDCARTNRSYQFFSAFDGMAANPTIAVAIDGRGRKWFAHGQVDAALSVLDTLGQWRTVGPRDGLLLRSGKTATTLFASGDSVWAGTESGVTLFVDGRPPFRLDADDALPSDNVRAITALGGHVWVATEGGLARLDGGFVTTFTRANGLPSDTLLSLATHPTRPEVWVGSLTGVAVVSSDGDTIRSLPLTGLADTEILEIAFQDTTAWVGTRVGPARWNGNAWDLRTGGLSEPEVPALAFGGNAGFCGVSALLSTTSAGIGIYTSAGGGSWVRPGLAGSPRSNFFGSLDVDASGNVWTASSVKRDGARPGVFSQVLRYNGTRFDDFERGDGLTSNLPDIIRVDPQGRKWIGFWDIGGGLNRLSASGTAVDTFKVDVICDDVVSNEQACTQIRLDALGNVWSTWEFYGLTCIDPATRQCVSWGATEGLPPNAAAGRGPSANAFAFDRRGRVWIGFGRGSGYASLVDTRGTLFDRSDDLVVRYNQVNSAIPVENVHAVEADSAGRIWFGTDEGLAIHNPNPGDSSWVVYTVGGAGSNLLSGSIRSIAFLPNGSALIGDNAGNVYTLRSDLTTWGPTYNLTTVGFPNARVSEIKYDAGNGVVWFALYGGGLVSLDPDDAVGPGDPSDSTRVVAVPNPWVFGSGDPEEITIENVRPGAAVSLYTLAGELVRTLPVREGTDTVVWDLRNAAGGEAASGVYIFIVRKNGVDFEHGKLALIR
jgi:streptogramin lyase